MDSDKDYSEDNVGTSLRNARAIYYEKEKNHIINLYELKVREKENLIPPSIFLLMEKPVRKELLDYLSSLEGDTEKSQILRYLDIKDGLKAKKWKSNNNQWHKLYGELLESLDTKGLLACSLEDIQSKNEDDLILYGIGCSAVEKFQKEVLCDGLIKKKKTKEELLNNGVQIPQEQIDELQCKVEITRNLFKNLPEYIIDDWIDICEEVLAWGCCALESDTIFHY